MADDDLHHFRLQIDHYRSQTDQLEEKVDRVVEYYEKKKQEENNRDSLAGELKGKKKVVEKIAGNYYQSKRVKKRLGIVEDDVSRMQDVIDQFGVILKQIMQHKWAWPFIDPVDVVGLGLDDYYMIVKKPMDFTTITKRIEAKDDSRYRNVRDIYADVSLVFSNAMTYNEEGSDIYEMAKGLHEMFEKRWQQLLPQVVEVETKQKEEVEALAHANMHIAEEATFTKMSRDTSNELDELNMRLDELREMVIQQCRRMSTEDKRNLGVGLSTLSPEDLNKALEVIAQSNPDFHPTGEVVDLDMDAQSEATLWKLRLLVKQLQVAAKNTIGKEDGSSKRKKKIAEPAAKASKKSKKL